MASEKRCHYEVLGLSRDCTPEDIRSAYKKLALQRHPDKLIQSGLSQAEATARFQELAHAYEVLSDPKERAWYDSHRSQILFADPNPSSANSGVPDLFSFFSNTVYSGYSDSGRGFYKVYSELFSKIYANEIDFATKLGLGRDSVPEAPAMGNLESPYAQVTAFYNYWLGFITVMDFCWVDQYDAMAGPNRRSRRVMEEENKKVRKKARREYNETVRGLAEFVKKRDKRVIDMAMKRNLEMERRREIERERKRELERERLEKIKAYVEPEWAKAGEEEEEEEEERNEREEKAELYCVICGKKFKSEKQWKNHEQSKKHKEKVAEFRDSLGDEDSIEGEDDIEDEGGKVVEEENEEERVVNELGQGFRDGLEIKEEVDGNGFYVVQDSHGDFGNDGNENDDDEEEEEEEEDEDEDEDDEMGVLKAMLAGHRSRKNVGQQREVKAAETGSEGLARDEDEIAGVGFMDYNNRKSSRRNRGNKERRKRNGDTPTDVTNKIDDQSRETNANGSSNLEEPSSSHAFAEQSNDKGDDQLARDKKASKQPVDKKGTGKKDTNAKLKNSSKQKKSKATSKNSSNLCDTCGVEFESRNRLHKHLGETGHAAPKSR